METSSQRSESKTSEEDSFCTNCGVKADITSKYCGVCGNKLLGKSISAIKPQPSERGTSACKPEGTEYFCIAPIKLMLLTLCTFGLYVFYWCYKNGRAIKEQEDESTSPFWTAVLAPISIYGLFDRILVSAGKVGYNIEHRASSYYFLFVSGIIMMESESASEFLQDQIWNIFNIINMDVSVFKAIGLMLFLFPLYHIQKVIVFNNSKIAPTSYKKDYSLTDMDILVIVIGGILITSIFFNQ